MKKVLFYLFMVVGLQLKAADVDADQGVTAPVSSQVDNSSVPGLVYKGSSASLSNASQAPSANLQGQVMQSAQKVTAGLSEADMQALMPILQSAFQATLVSDKFDEEMTKLSKDILALTIEFSRNVSNDILKNENVALFNKIVDALASAEEELNNFVRDGKSTDTAGKIYVVRIARAILHGLQNSFGQHRQQRMKKPSNNAFQ